MGQDGGGPFSSVYVDCALELQLHSQKQSQEGAGPSLSGRYLDGEPASKLECRRQHRAELHLDGFLPQMESCMSAEHFSQQNASCKSLKGQQ